MAGPNRGDYVTDEMLRAMGLLSHDTPAEVNTIINSDDILYTRGLDHLNQNDGCSVNVLPPSQRQDKLCSGCFRAISNLDIWRPIGTDWYPCEPREERTGLQEALFSLQQCSFCIFFTRLKENIGQPRKSFMKTTVEEARATEGHIATMGLENIMTLCSQDYEVPTDLPMRYPSVTGGLAYSHQNKLALHGSINTELVRSWISRCSTEHGNRCGILESNSQNLTALPMIAIDVHRKCLVEITSKSRYVTLSYVWGGIEPLKLYQANREALFTESGLVEVYNQIPTITQNAISFVASISESYLWVDCLCIQQDDPAEKARQIANMATIYKSSLLTIVTVSNIAANTPLPGVQARGVQADAVAPIPGIFLSRRTPRLLDAVTSSTYHTRGWTLQERLLSKRCLYFLPDQVHFQCQSSIWCEDRNVDYSEDLHTLNPMIGLMHSSPSLATDVPNESHHFELYCLLVSEYLKKNLTDQSDILNAFAGFMQAMKESCGWAFKHGMPLEMIDVALLWANSVTDYSLRGPIQSSLGAEARCEPSWSWSAWRGSVNWELMITWGGRAKSLIGEFLFHDADGTSVISRDFEKKVVHNSSSEYNAVTRKRKRDDEAEHSYPAILPTSLLFTASIVPFNKFTYTHETVIWKPPGAKPFPPPLGQHILRLSNLLGDLCGIIYGLSPDSIHDIDNFDLIGLSTLEYVPKLSYVVAQRGKCWKSCCSASRVNRIFEGNLWDEREGCLVNVMLLRRVERGVGLVCRERVAVGHVHVDAWDNCDPVEESIVLI